MQTQKCVYEEIRFGPNRYEQYVATGKVTSFVIGIGKRRNVHHLRIIANGGISNERVLIDDNDVNVDMMAEIEKFIWRKYHRSQ